MLNGFRSLLLFMTAAGMGLAQQSYSHGPIVYHGGALLTGNLPAYIIVYGRVPNSSVQSVSRLINDLSGSPWAQIATTYSDESGRPGADTWSIRATVTDNYSRGRTLRGQADLNDILTAQIDQGHLPSNHSALYFILLPDDVTYPDFPSKGCGEHFSTRYRNGLTLHFAAIPSARRWSASLGCLLSFNAADPAPNGDMTGESMANVAAHELMEMVTDPDANAWYTSVQGALEELGDKCVRLYGHTFIAPNGAEANMSLKGRDYKVQELWVNRSAGYCSLTIGR